MKKSKVIFLALFAYAFGVSAETVTVEDVKTVASNWAKSGTAMGLRLPSRVTSATEYAVTNGYSFYEVKMNGSGTVFVSSDTDFEPIIGFSSNGSLDMSEGSPLLELLKLDIAARAALKAQSATKRPLLGTTATATATAATGATAAAASSAQKKWASLLRRTGGISVNGAGYATGTGEGGSVDPVESIDDVRVAPLVDSVWSQTYDDDYNLLYNYYIPEEIACGCTATAAAQIMRYFRYPVDSMPEQTYACSVNYEDTNCTTVAGVYNWDLMPADPNEGATDEEREMVGRLCYDIAAALETSWTDDGGGSAYANDLAKVFTGASFCYSNAYVYSDYGFDMKNPTYNGGLHVLEAREKTIYANLDARRPVELGIHGYAKNHFGDVGYWAGHAVVGDGYGFKTIDGEPVAFVHINMGWAGTDNLWYNIPEVNSANSGAHIGDSGYDFVFMGSALFNVSPDNTGDILSGRIVDDDGVGISNATVVAELDGAEVARTVSDEHGIYAFALEGGHTYAVSATMVNAAVRTLMADCEVALGKTTGDETGNLGTLEQIGNRWGNDMELAEPTVRIVVGDVTNLYTSLDRALKAATNGDDMVEILLPTILKKPVTLTNDCTIVATNDNPAASAVSCRDGAKITINRGATVTVQDVAFGVEDDAKTIAVEDDGLLCVGGYCDLMAVETAAYSNLLVIADLTYPFAVDCKGAQALGETFAMATLAPEEAAASAPSLLHYSNTRLGGEAYEDDGVKFRWSREAPVPIQKTVAQLRVAGGTTVNYRALADLFEDYDGNEDAEITIRKSLTIANYLDVTHEIVMRGEGDERPVLTAAPTSGFNITDGGSLHIANLVFSGYDDPNYQDETGFVYVDGGALTLDDGAEFNSITGRVYMGSGVIDLMRGSVTTLPGSAILDCLAEGGENNAEDDEFLKSSGGFGGAVFVLGDDCSLNLFGGTIARCRATEYGGGVYAYGYGDDAGVCLSNDVVVAGNSSDNHAADDVYVRVADAIGGFKVVGLMSGRVGVRYAVGQEGNALGEAFVTYASGMTVSQVRASAACFFNDTDADGLYAKVVAANRQFVWDEDIDDGTCEPAQASARVYYTVGEREGEVWYYPDVETAFAYMIPGTTNKVVMFRSGQDHETFKSDIVVPDGCDVTLTSGGSVTYGLWRTNACSFKVPAGSALTLTNIYVSGSFKSNTTWVVGGRTTLFDVEGGTLRLRNGATVARVNGKTDRASNGITVSAGGTLEMDVGSSVESCRNNYDGSSGATTDYAVGGGVLIEDSVAYLRGGKIASCRAKRAGGLYACNGAKVYVSGGFTAKNNASTSGATENIEVADTSELYLDGKLTGTVGKGFGQNWIYDTNIVAKVSPAWAWDVEALTNSAACFVNDVTGEKGVAVTNAAEALIVWQGAVSNGVYTNWTNGGYALVTSAVAESLLPKLPTGAGSAAISKELAKLSDSRVAEKITTLKEYNDFATWAAGVEGGKEAVAASDKAYVSYEFGTTELFEEDPTVEIAQAENEEGGLSVSVVVKDGEDPVEVASAKVKKMFEATDDVGDWSDLLELTVTDLTQSTADAVWFTVKPAGSPAKAFIRLKY